MYNPAPSSRAKFRLLARSAGIIKPGAAIIPRSSLLALSYGILRPHPLYERDSYSFIFFSPQGKLDQHSVTRVTAPIMRPAGLDSTKNHLSSVFDLANSSRWKEPEDRSWGRGRGRRRRGNTLATRTRRGFRRDKWCIAHAPLKSVPGVHPLPLRRNGENQKKRETERGKRDRGERRRQLGQTLNNLDNGRTALNSCRFVQAHRLIRLAGRLQCWGREEWDEVPVNFRCLPRDFPRGLSPPSLFLSFLCLLLSLFFIYFHSFFLSPSLFLSI